MGLVPRLFAPVSGSAATMIADACWSCANASAGEISFAVLIGNESSSIPTACAASFVCVFVAAGPSRVVKLGQLLQQFISLSQVRGRFGGRKFRPRRYE